MKESELIKKMSEIQQHLNKTNIINKACIIAIEKGKGETGIKQCHSGGIISREYRFIKDGLDIKFSDFPLDREIRVYYLENAVLIGSNNFVKDSVLVNRRDIERKYSPWNNGFFISIYKPGKWEKKIEEYIKEENIIETDIGDFDVPKSILEELSRNFNLKL